ncbi:MAG: hypothetical protein IKW28_10900 [Lachnospiraceae bacterium]|nr:hypothetical protein [Lachnospiraceae bacterium]
MRKKEFLESLEQLLWDLTEEERKEALQYYIDYFEDAGISEEEDVTKEFGRPEKVAARIKVELTEDHSEYSENGFEDIRFEDVCKNMPQPYPDYFSENQWETVGEDIIQQKKKKERTPLSFWKIILIVVLILFASPVLLPLIVAGGALALSLVIGIIALAGSLILGAVAIFLAIALGGLVGGVLLMFNGIVKLFTVPSLGAISLGVGGIFIAGGILSGLALIWLAVKIFRPILRKIIEFLYKIFHKGGNKV